MRYARTFAAALLFSAVAVGPSVAQSRDPAQPGPVTGTITMVAKGVGVGVGVSWGDGTLRYEGRSHPFSVGGVSVGDVGYSEITAQGRVYNLKRLSEFSGTYVAATGEATIGRGLAGQVLRNANGVEIRVDQVTEGVRLQGSVDGITLTLK